MTTPLTTTEAAFDKNSALSVAFELLGLINTCRFALDNETSAVPIENRGIDRTLDVASGMAEELLDHVERIERGLPIGKEAHKAA